MGDGKDVERVGWCSKTNHWKEGFGIPSRDFGQCEGLFACVSGNRRRLESVGSGLGVRRVLRV